MVFGSKRSQWGVPSSSTQLTLTNLSCQSLKYVGQEPEACRQCFGKEHAARSLVSWAKVLLGQVEPIHRVITLLIHKTTVSRVDPAGRNCTLNAGWHTFNQVQIGTIRSLAIMMRSQFTLGGRRGKPNLMSTTIPPIEEENLSMTSLTTHVHKHHRHHRPRGLKRKSQT